MFSRIRLQILTVRSHSGSARFLVVVILNYLIFILERKMKYIFLSMRIMHQSDNDENNAYRLLFSENNVNFGANRLTAICSFCFFVIHNDVTCDNTNLLIS